MLAALVSSALFLTSYLVYHFHVGSVRFRGRGPGAHAFTSRSCSAHTVLRGRDRAAGGIVTLARALRGRFDRHRRHAPAMTAAPVGLASSVTGRGDLLDALPTLDGCLRAAERRGRRDWNRMSCHRVPRPLRLAFMPLV